MTSSSNKFLRLFILLLLTVFISETVYASSMMAAMHIASNHVETQVEHCHEEQLVKNSQQAHEKQQSQANCHDCSHCFACFSMLPQASLSAPALQKQVIAAAVFVEIYHSPSTLQALKPPIA